MTSITLPVERLKTSPTLKAKLRYARITDASQLLFAS